FLQKPPHHDIGVWPLQIGDSAGAEPDFGGDRVVVSRDALERGDEKGVSSVEVGQVEHADAPSVSVADEGLEFFLAHPGRVGLPITPMHTRTEPEAAYL